MTRRGRTAPGTNTGSFAPDARAEAQSVTVDGEPPVTEMETWVWSDGFFNDERGVDYAEACQVSEWAAGMCCDVSEAFADYLYAEGETDVKTVDMTSSGHEFIPDGVPHTVVVVRGHVVDLTFRQFDRDAPLPVSEPAEEYLSGWRVHSFD